jgi:aminoglycoside/choline kinase family phosphotransferase
MKVDRFPLKLTGFEQDEILWLTRTYANVFGEAASEVLPLKGDAGDRRLLRLRGASTSAIGVVGPSVDENRAFVSFARSFSAHGLAVPCIHAVDDRERCYLEDDFGDTTLALWLEDHRSQDGLDEAAEMMYRRVLDELVRFQIDAADEVDYSLCYQSGVFGIEAMLFDLAYFREMFLTPLVRLPWDEHAFTLEGRQLVAMLQAEQQYFLYRDFQSRNVMIHEDIPRFIDFQSGRRGALHYDVAALLFDSKGRLPAELRLRLLAHYLDRVGERFKVDRARFGYLFEGFAVLRLVQALGAFGNLGLNKNKPGYLSLIPSRLHSLGTLVSEAEIMQQIPYLRRLLIEISGDPAALELPTLDT